MRQDKAYRLIQRFKMIPLSSLKKVKAADAEKIHALGSSVGPIISSQMDIAKAKPSSIWNWVFDTTRIKNSSACLRL